jgi:ArsR family transcriptional regulator, arsenate/arsenite/antimonite-responsive transcriptional repressor
MRPRNGRKSRRVGSCLTAPFYFHYSGNMEKQAALAALAALAQESRLDIYRLLVQAGSAGIPAGQIGERLELPAPTLSFHLNQLRQAGLISFQRQGRSLIYATEYEKMNDLLAYLTENCCQGEACESTQCRPAAARRTHKGETRDETRTRARRR